MQAPVSQLPAQTAEKPPSPQREPVAPRPRPRPHQKVQPTAPKLPATLPPPTIVAQDVVVSMPRGITRAPEKANDAASKKRVRHADDAAPTNNAAIPADKERDSEPLAKKVKVKVVVQKDRRREKRTAAVKGTKKNSKPCRYCRNHGHECWRQGGPFPRGSCFECASAKQKCGDTEANWAEIQQEKDLEMAEEVQKAREGKGKKAARPVSTKPAASATPAPKATKVTKPPAPAVAGPSKPKVPKTPAGVDIAADEAKSRSKNKGKGKQVYKSAPIVLSSGSESAPAPKVKGTFRGTQRHR